MKYIEILKGLDLFSKDLLFNLASGKLHSGNPHRH